MHKEMQEAKKLRGSQQAPQARLRSTTTRYKHDLEERVKELACLYSLSVITGSRDISLDELFHRAVDLIPPAWQYPKITCGRIVFDDREYVTKGFETAPWKLDQEIIVDNKRAGVVEVFYTPFTSEPENHWVI